MPSRRVDGGNGPKCFGSPNCVGIGGARCVGPGPDAYRDAAYGGENATPTSMSMDRVSMRIDMDPCLTVASDVAIDESFFTMSPMNWVWSPMTLTSWSRPSKALHMPVFSWTSWPECDSMIASTLSTRSEAAS